MRTRAGHRRCRPAMALAAALTLAGPAAASAPDPCEGWYRRSGAVPGAPDCVVRCMGAPVGMADFACPPGCRDWCGRGGGPVPFGPAERAALRQVLEKLYGPAVVSGWTLRPEMLEVLGDLLAQAGRCAVLTGLLPSPPATPPGPAWVARQLGRLARGLSAASGHRLLCMRVAAVRHRTQLELLGRPW